MKKALSMLLAIVMVFSLLPMAVFAATIPTVYFETDFSADMGVGDTFIVKCMLKDNEEFGGFTLSLKWNEDVVKFTGFDVNKRGALISDVFIYNTPIFNPELGIVVANDIYGHDTNGMMFIANFEIIGSGDLDIGLKTADRTEYEFIDVYGEVMDSIIDTSALDGLAVAGSGNAGAAIPKGAPFTAVTTNAGAVIAVEDCGTLSVDPWGMGTGTDVPYYHITIPKGATETYVTFDNPISAFMSQTAADDSPEIGSSWSIANENETESGMAGLAFIESGDDTVVIIPLEFNGNPWGDEDMKSTVKVYYEEDDEYDLFYAVGPQDSSASTIAVFSLEFGEASGEEEPTYRINFDNIVGGEVYACDADGNEITEAKAGDEVHLDYEAEEGYTMLTIGYIYNGTFYHCENGVFNMPAGDITIFATFKAPTYNVTVNSTQNGTVVADKAAAAAGEKVTLTVTPAADYKLDTLTVMQGNTEIEVVNNEFTMPAGAVTVSATFKKVIKGYTFATSADVSSENGGTATVHVKITGHSDPNVTTYNAYDLTLTYDNTKLEFVGGVGADEGDQIKIQKKGDNQIHIVGVGDAKTFNVEVATLTFKTIAEGNATVTIDKVQVSNKDEAVNENIPEATPKHDEADTDADETPDASVIVVPYSVTKPDFISGNDKILHGEDYTFSYTDTTNYTYSDLTVTVGGEEVAPSLENGIYTIENVTGTVVITATQTAKSYDVTKPENVTGPDKATYGTDYVFTATPSSEDMAIDTVTVKYADGSEVPYTLVNGEYVIAGTDITGAFTITVTEKEKMTTITFSGIEEDEIDGGKLTMAAEIGKDFTFKLIKKEGFDYTVKVGETELTESKEVAGQYTIPAEQVVKGGVAVAIEKVDNTTATVDVTEYINLDGKTMFLITAKWGEKVLAYGEGNTMYWSDKYTVTGEEEAGAYCWLVVSTEEMKTIDQVKAAAETAIVEAAKDATATTIKYNYDINGTTKVDVNDAQLAYDMYNASYMDFNDDLPMLKFLEADVKTDSKLDTQDVAAIINYIINGANA